MEGAEDPPDRADAPMARSPRQFAIGLALLLATVFLWVGSSFLMSNIFNEQSYAAPWLITYICTASFTVYLVRPLARHFIGPKVPAPLRKADNSRGAYERVPSDEHVRSRSRSRTGDRSPLVEPPMTTREVSHLAGLFVGLWFLANWAINASLQYTSVSAVTILSSTSGFWTLGAGILLGVEKLEILRVLSVVTSVVGVVMVSRGDRQTDDDASSGHKQWLGHLLALASAALYAGYVLLMKVKVRHESRIDMQLFFGFVGLYNIVFFWPIGVILHLTGVEPFRIPDTRALWLSVGVSGLITVLSDYAYMLAMLKTSPLVVTLGLSLTLPVAVCGDLLKGEHVSAVSVMGGLLVLGAFALLSIVQRHSDA